MDRLRRDVRHAFQRLGRDRGFAAVAILTLGLGIGANTAVAGLVRTVLLRPLPYGDPASLAMIWHGTEAGDTTWLSMQEVISYGRDTASVEQVGGYTTTDLNLTGGQEPERVRAAAMTPNLFAVLKVGAEAGRTFVERDGAPGADPVVILGHGLWQRRFGGDAAIVGRPVQVNGRAVTVVGIMPPAFRLPTDYRDTRPTEAWVPETIDPVKLGAWGNRSCIGVARVKAGVHPAAVTSELAVVADRWIRAGYVVDQGDGGLFRSAIQVQDFIAGGAAPALLILGAAVGAVLLIACANVVILLLAKAGGRSRDAAVRTALGAGRGAIVRELLTESVILSFAGGACGLGIAWAATRLLVSLHPASLPRIDGASSRARPFLHHG